MLEGGRACADAEVCWSGCVGERVQQKERVNGRERLGGRQQAIQLVLEIRFHCALTVPYATHLVRETVGTTEHLFP